MFSSYSYLTKGFALIADFTTIAVALGIAQHFYGSGNPPKYLEHWHSHVFMAYALWFLASYRVKLYDAVPEFIPLLRSTGKGLVIFVILTLVYIFIQPEHAISRWFLATFFGFTGFMVMFTRISILAAIKPLERVKPIKKRVVIVGNSDMSYKAARYFSQPNSGYEFVGFFDDYNSSRQGFPFLGNLDNCLQFAKKNKIDTIYSTLMPSTEDALREMVTEAERNFIRFKFIPDFNLLFHRKVNLTVEGDLPVISLREEPMESITNRINKRLFDLAFSLIVFATLLWWLIPLIAICIKLDSNGPVFFIQKRSGRNNRIFRCYKFRSMRQNDDAHDVQASKGDARITRLGRFLRRSNLDELPQFVNVLLGDVSVVGPRPHMLKHTEEYSFLISKYMVRHFIKPGITGWAQINGYRGDLNRGLMEKRVEFDIWYMENWSLLLDVKIILKTALKIFKWDKNAY